MKNQLSSKAFGTKGFFNFVQQIFFLALLIAVNTRLLIKDQREGIGRFAYETLRRIAVNNPEHQFLFIFDRVFDPAFVFSSNVKPLVTGPKARHPFLFLIWFEISVRAILKKYKPDIFLSPDGYICLSADVNTVAVVHDLNFEHYPSDLPFLAGLYYRFFFPLFCRKAKRIATVSKFSKEDIVKTYGINPGKIDVVYNGISKSFAPLNSQEKDAIKNQYTGGCDYFLFVGSQHPRKNLSRLIKAFEKFKIQTKSDVKLVLAGKKYYWSGEMKKTFMESPYKNEIIFTGKVNDHEIAQITASALALTYLSYFEGFGIPIIEAMKCNVPVVAANTSSIPEIASDAALLVDPFSIHAIAEALVQIYEHEDLRNLLCQKGQKRCLEFSWDNTADLLWNCIEKAAGVKTELGVISEEICC
jgi:glycosyltransferase involved in cell wall biosynthesis